VIGRMISGLIAASAVAVGALAVAGPAPIPTGPGPQIAPVAAAEAVCAGVGRRPKVAGFVATADLPTSTGTGTVTSTAAGKTVLDTPVGGVALQTNASGPVPALVSRAVGAAAPGLAVTRTSQFPDGPGRGYLLQACSAPSPLTWFVGGHSGIGRTTTLQLVNPDPTSAQIDLTIYGPAGVVDAPGGRGIPLAGYSARNIVLTTLAPDLPLVAVSVQAVTGRVTASALDLGVNGLKSLGATALQPTGAATRLIIPGVPANVANATLQLVAPGATAAQAQVRLLTTDGQFIPVGGGTLNLAADQVVTLDLTRGLAGQAAAVLITATEPVVAGVRFQTSMTLPGVQVGALVAAAGLTSPALVPGLEGTAGVDLYLAAGGASGRVAVAVWLADRPAPEAARTIAVPTGRQVRVTFPTRPTLWWTLVVTPVDGGALSGTVIVTTPPNASSLLASLPLAGLRQTVQLPAAHLDLGVAQP
jgi:hypothetical protein